MQFVEKSLTLDLTTPDGNREWLVETQPDRILLLSIQSADEPLDLASIESILTVCDILTSGVVYPISLMVNCNLYTDKRKSGWGGGSIVFPAADSESTLSIYSTGNSVLIRVNHNKFLLNGKPQLQLKVEKVQMTEEWNTILHISFVIAYTRLLTVLIVWVHPVRALGSSTTCPITVPHLTTQ